MSEFSTFMSMVLTAGFQALGVLLVAVIGYFALLAVPAARKWINDKTELAKVTLGAANFELATLALHQVIRAAQQSGLAGLIENIGAVKKAYVKEKMQAWFDERHIDFSVDELDTAIEGELRVALYPVVMAVSASTTNLIEPTPAYVPETKGGDAGVPDDLERSSFRPPGPDSHY